MNISQMILAEVTPLSEYAAERVREYATRKRDKAAKKEAAPKAPQESHLEAIARYKAAWKDDEWLPTREIEIRLGMGKCIVSPTLRKWMDSYKLLERRPVGGVYHRHKGHEWRWVK